MEERYCTAPEEQGKMNRPLSFCHTLPEEKSTFALVYPDIKILARCGSAYLLTTAFRGRGRKIRNKCYILSATLCEASLDYMRPCLKKTFKVILEYRIHFCPQRSPSSTLKLYKMSSLISAWTSITTTASPRGHPT
jgi:hypothetical protein